MVTRSNRLSVEIVNRRKRLKVVAAVYDRRKLVSKGGDAHRAPLHSPTMICRMPFFHGDEDAATGGANFSTGAQTPVDGRAIFCEFDHARG